MSPSLGKCSQCDREALFVGGPNKAPLCLYCAKVLQDIADSQFRMAREGADRAEREMHQIFGLPLPPHLQPKTPVIAHSVQNVGGVHVSGGTVGLVNTGTIERAHVSIQTVPDTALRNALQALERAVEDDQGIDTRDKTEAIEAIGALAEDTAKPQDQRRTIMLRGVAERLAAIVSVGKSAAEAWKLVQPLLKTYFGW